MQSPQLPKVNWSFPVEVLDKYCFMGAVEAQEKGIMRFRGLCEPQQLSWQEKLQVGLDGAVHVTTPELHTFGLLPTTSLQTTVLQTVRIDTERCQTYNLQGSQTSSGQE